MYLQLPTGLGFWTFDLFQALQIRHWVFLFLFCFTCFCFSVQLRHWYCFSMLSPLFLRYKGVFIDTFSQYSLLHLRLTFGKIFLPNEVCSLGVLLVNDLLEEFLCCLSVFFRTFFLV